LDPATAPSTSGNFRLSDCSPAANVGNNVGVSATDLDGNPRIFNTTVDLGAYERQTNSTAPATWYADADGDTFGNPAVSVVSCNQPTGYVSNNLDCNDSNAAINPNTLWYLDADNDGYYTGTGVTQCASPGAGYRYTGILGGGDCND
ncbi:MAG TPA: choice-of-anchor Q domain-containing protein, partial [Saprospiraceae bacterium]|nr:choice-of-anchor Q domain-containing protein [Saprospiraceae bacterium]